MSAIHAVKTVMGKKANVTTPSQISITPGEKNAKIAYIQI